MKGRKLGQIEVTLEEIQTIATMTGQYSRKQIAQEINRSMDTVFRYQKKFGMR